MPSGVNLEIATINGIPLYDADLEASEGIPLPVMALMERIAASNGLLLATPEYNNGIPGVFKNAIDWLSWPPADIPRVFGNRSVAGASLGGFGTILAQNAWRRYWYCGHWEPVRGAVDVCLYHERAACSTLQATSRMKR
jgi:NAD(P)H-dependent FMN reductase